jgi:hypothetical protein
VKDAHVNDRTRKAIVLSGIVTVQSSVRSV